MNCEAWEALLTGGYAEIISTDVHLVSDDAALTGLRGQQGHGCGLGLQV